MNNWFLDDLLEKHYLNGHSYSEFLRSPSMSVGIYALAKGAVDPQHPHSEDEMYYVVQGSAQLTVEEDDIPVQPGSLVLVKAYQTHRFHDILEDIIVLVFFAPAEYRNSYE